MVNFVDTCILTNLLDIPGYNQDRDAVMREYEEKLGLARRFVEIQAGLDEITRCAQDISIYNDKFLGSAEVEKRTARICELASQLND